MGDGKCALWAHDELFQQWKNDSVIEICKELMRNATSALLLLLDEVMPEYFVSCGIILKTLKGPNNLNNPN